MNTLLFCLTLTAAQMSALQRKPVVHLQPTREVIGLEYGGDLLELSNSAAVIALPAIPPRVDSKGSFWAIDVKNLGPHTVTLVGKDQFSVPVNVGRTVHIVSTGSAYSLKQ